MIQAASEHSLARKVGASINDTGEERFAVVVVKGLGADLGATIVIV